MDKHNNTGASEKHGRKARKCMVETRAQDEHMITESTTGTDEGPAYNTRRKGKKGREEKGEAG